MKHNWIIRAGGVAITVIWIYGSFVGSGIAADWPMLGRDGTRNGVSVELDAPTLWSIEERKGDRVIRASRGIRWSAPLGSQTHSSPIVSGEFVWIGTNSVNPGVEVHSVLKCFRVSDGQQVYEYDSPKRGTRNQDAGWTGLGSSPLIEGDRLWLTTNRSEVLCLDILPLVRGAGPPRELWKLDLVQAFDICPHVPLMGPPRPCSIGPSWNGRIFVTTNNGVDEFYIKVPKPEAPNLVCLDKETGEVYWKDNSPGTNILSTQFASPTVAEIRGQMQLIVPQSDGWLRSFDPMTGEKLWEFDVNVKQSVHSPHGRGTRNSLLGNAVIYEDRVYLASGQDAERGEGPGRLVCIDPTKRGDVSSELALDADGQPLPRRRVQAVDPKAGEKASPNPNSALVWEFVSVGKKFEDLMHRTMGSVAIAKGLVIVGDAAGVVHCLDAKTGQRHWRHDMLSTIWASPLIVDDKVYVTDEDGLVAIFDLSANQVESLPAIKDESQPLHEISMVEPIYSSPSFANGVLYVATRNTLFAIADNKDEPIPEPLGGETSGGTKTRTLRSVFVPTPHDIVEQMLKLANVKESDVVYDLGSGDGRIVLSAAQTYCCRAIGYELDKELVDSSRAKAKSTGVDSLVTIEHKDLFTADLSEADVVALYLLPQQLEKLLPQLNQLKPGTRIVSHQFAIPGVSIDKVVQAESLEDSAKHKIYLWTSPLTEENKPRP